MKKFIGEGLKATGPNLNVLNVLRTLIEDTNAEVYIPYSYQSESKGYTGDPKVHWLPKEAGTPVKVTGIISNQERFNFSLSAVVNVFVSEDKEGSTTIVPKKLFRNYTVIRDGNLEINYLYVKINDVETYKDLSDAGILRFSNGVTALHQVHVFNPNYVYKVVLDTIPLISLNWAQPYNIGLYDYMIREVQLAQKIKILKATIREFKAAGQFIPSEDSDFYSEQKSYTSTSDETRADEVKKPVPCVVYEFPGMKTEDAFLDPCEISDIKSASEALKKYNKEIKSIRFISRCIVMAIELSAKKGSYNWSETVKSTRSDKEYKEADVQLENGTTVTLRRTVYTKNV